MANVEWASDSEESIVSNYNDVINDDPRSLESEEIDNIVNGLRFGLKHSPVQENIINIHREKTRRKLITIKIRPSKIAELKKIIHQHFYTSVIAPGEAIGVNAAQCIGEPTTQMSTLGTERVLLFSVDGTYYNGKIGQFIDQLMINNDKVVDLGKGSEVLHFDSEKYFILTVNPNNQNCAWKALSEVSRHPANGGMITVTTQSGRSVTTTLSHSHLRRTNKGTIEPILGADLKIGDRIPIGYSIPHRELVDISNIPYIPYNHLSWYIGSYLAGNKTSYNEEISLLKDFKNASGEKCIPSWIFFAPLEFINSLLRGFFDTSGIIDSNKGCLTAYSTNTVLLENISMLLAYSGIFAIFKDVNTIIISHTYISQFVDKIGSDKSVNLKEFLKICDSVVTFKDPCNIKIYEDSDVVWDEIIKIELSEDPKTLVYDFGVHGNHTFCINAGIFIHNTLNSVAPWEKIFYQTNDGDIKLVTIGDWIDSLMEKHTDKIEHIPKNNTQYLELESPVWTPSSNDEGNLTWEAVTAVTKHLPCGDLVRVRTHSGREATVTRSKSLLVWDPMIKKFVEKGGADVILGDLLPVTCDFPKPNVIKTHINLREYLSPKKWVYANELINLYQEWSGSVNTRAKRQGFWLEKNRLENLPYSRPDTAIEAARLNRVKKDCVYPKRNSRVKSCIPEQFPLDRDFGTIVGLYLAGGWATNTFIGISNNDNSIQKLLEEWCDKYKIIHSVITSTDFKIHSVLLAHWFKKWIGTESANKKIPIEAFVAQESFVIGILDGYFAGDGTINKRNGSLTISAASEDLIKGFGVLCTRFSIFGIKYKYSYRITNESAKRWVYTIGSFHPEKRRQLIEITLKKNYSSSFWNKQCNVILDPIVELTDVPATDWVYDLTIPTTKNFSLWDGLNLNDTFHSAGISAKNVTLGFPRARELFNSTRAPANPTCTIYFNRDNRTLKELHKVVDKIPQATIDDLLTSWETFDPEEYKYEYWHIAWFKLNSSDALTEDEWCLRLSFNVGKLYNRDLTIKEIAEGIKTSYSDVRVIPSPLNLGIVDVIVNCAEINIVGERSKELDDIEDLYEERRFYMDKIVSPKIRGQLICGVPGITEIYRRKAKCNESFGGFPLKPEIAAKLGDREEEWIVDTDGTNLPAILALPGVDPYRTISNDMWEILYLLGIEAARKYLFIEFMNIVNSGGTTINPVHIETLVGKMTYTGSIRAIARFGVETSQYDPIARATFEEVMSQLVTSAMFSERDNLSGISSNIVLGTKIRAGTGIVNLEKIPLKIIPQMNQPQQQRLPKIRPPMSIQTEDDIITEDI